MRDKSSGTLSIKKSNLLSTPLWIIPVVFLLIIFTGQTDLVLKKTTPVPSTENVIHHLKNLEKLAGKHDNSRSVANGHAASVDYVVAALAQLNETFTYHIQEVSINVQVDSEPPLFLIKTSKTGNITFEPRIDVATYPGSGSVILDKVAVKFISGCSVNQKFQKDWIAAIDTSLSLPCSVCQRLIESIDAGARGVVLFNKPGNTKGYPHALPPQPGRCGRDPENHAKIQKIGAVQLSDYAAFQFLSQYASYPDTKASLTVQSVYREFISKNVIADSIQGNPDSVVVFGSHLDSVPAGPGVNDDGSGAMATLELANYFHQYLAKKTVQKLRFTWWTGEEIGLLGSVHYVNDLKQHNPSELSNIVLNIDTDMIASPNYVRGVWSGNNLKEPALYQKCKSIHMLFKDYFSAKGLPIVEFEFNGRSDFQPFLDAGIPAGGVITGEDEIKTVEQAQLFGGVSGMDCDRVESILGSGVTIMEQNMGALGHALDTYALAADIKQLLSPIDE
ncbi:hypothetical protein HDV01_002086 [Terramyces sp. JEL0728]|nr:hypothetical protein HDV01_002086 [Terramyces sp. JEL0728]